MSAVVYNRAAEVTPPAKQAGFRHCAEHPWGTLALCTPATEGSRKRRAEAVNTFAKNFVLQM